MKILGSSLHDGQLRVVEEIKKGTKHVVVNAPRQTGKSFLSQQVILYWALNRANSVILVTAPTYSQLKRPFEEIVAGLEGAPIIKSANKSDFTIKFTNGSQVLFKSTQNPDTMRGLTADYAVLDEAAYMNESVWNAVVKPILLVRGKQILFISTPAGKNWFYDMYMLGQSDDHPDYHSTTMRYEENPFVDAKEIEEARRTLPDHIFRAEYCAEFTDSGNTVFSNLDERQFHRWPQPVGKLFAGLDLGKANDWTVLTIMDERGQVVDIYRDNQKDWSYMVDEVLKRLQKWNAHCLVEVNSIGDVILDQLKKKYRHVNPFVTSATSKQRIIEQLIVDFNSAAISIPSAELFKPLRFELDIFTYQYSPKARSIQYTAPSGQHDDTVMSLAIANEARKSQATKGSYVVGGLRL